MNGGPVASEPGPTGVTAPICSNQSARAFIGYRPAGSRDTFYANLSLVPPGVTVDNFENTPRVGAANLNLNRNACNVSDAQAVSWYYGGGTSARPSLDRNLTCDRARRPCINVVSVLAINNAALAGTSRYLRGTQIDYWDVGIRYDAGRWASGATCPGGRYHLETTLRLIHDDPLI